MPPSALFDDTVIQHGMTTIRQMGGEDVTAVEHVTLQANGLSLRALVSGPDNGRPVLLLHGFPQSSQEWTAQLPVLAAAGYRAVAPDQRGYSPGARPEGVGPYAIDHLVADVLAICDELGADTVDLVGHDWGAIVAWAVATRHPERLRTHTAVSVPHPHAFADAYESPLSHQREMSSYIELFRATDGSAEALLGDLTGMFRTVGLTEEAAAAHAAVHAEPGGLTSALNWYRATHPTKMRGYPNGTVPTLFVWSTEDPAISREAADACVRYVDGPFQYEILPGVDHWIPELAADRFNELLLGHLARN
jgi:pimeloyl-ACP methyl ester carboxylesterase